MRTFLWLLVLMGGLATGLGAQTRPPQWIVDLELWGAKASVHPFIHAGLAAGMTAGGEVLTGNAWYGAMVGIGFFTGLEATETLLGWDSDNWDKTTDFLGPVASSLLVAWLFERNREKASNSSPVPVAPVPTHSVLRPMHEASVIGSETLVGRDSLLVEAGF